MTDAKRLVPVPASQKRPAVSVVVPTFNRGAWAADTVGSVLRQDLSDLEVIVADDASKDDTREHIEAIRKLSDVVRDA